MFRLESAALLFLGCATAGGAAQNQETVRLPKPQSSSPSAGAIEIGVYYRPDWLPASPQGVVVVHPMPGMQVISARPVSRVQVRFPGAAEPMVLTHFNFQPKAPGDDRWVFAVPATFTAEHVVCDNEKAMTELLVVDNRGLQLRITLPLCPGKPAWYSAAARD